MKLPKFVDKILTVIGYIFAFVPFVALGAYAADSALKLVTNDNTALELIAVSSFVLLGTLFYFFHIIIHEAGHLIGGLCTGWEFLSFRVGNLTLIRREGKFEWKKHTVMGTGGQCLMIPPQCGYEECPFYLYLLLGGCANLLTGGIALGIGLFTGGVARILCVLFAIMGFATGLSNLFPAKLSGIANDGYQIFFELPGGKEARKYVYCLLMANAVVTQADSTKAIPESVRKIIMELDDKDFSNISAVNLLFFKANILQEEERYEEVREIFQKIADMPGVLQLFKNEANCELLYYEIMGDCNGEKIEAIYDKKLMDYIKLTAMYPSRKRLMYAYHLIYKKDEAEADKEYQALLKTMETHPIRVECVMEMKEAQRVKEHFEQIGNVCD